MARVCVVAGPPQVTYGHLNLSPLDGASGRLLLKHLGLPRSQIHALRTRLQPAPFNEDKKQFKASWTEGEPRFRGELENALRDSKWVLTLGAEAFYAVSGIGRKFWNWLGAPLELERYPGVSCLPALTPSFLKTKGGVAYADLFGVHVGRFAALATGRLQAWQWPALEVDNDGRALAALQAIAASSEPVGIDIETDGIELSSDLVCIGFATRTHGAVSVTIAEGTPAELLFLVGTILSQPNRKKVWQNGSFDRYTLQHKGYILRGQDEDTLLLHSLLEPHHKHTLGFLASSYFHCPAWKAEHEMDSELVKSASRFSRQSEKFRETRLYNAKDAYMQVMLFHELSRLTSDLRSA